MTATPNARHYPSMPEGAVRYALMITTRVSRSFLGGDPMQLRSEGYGDLILIVIDAGEVRIEVTIGGDNAGSIEGRAHRAQMSTTAMPEPAQAVLLVAGLGVFALYRRRRRSSGRCREGPEPLLGR